MARETTTPVPVAPVQAPLTIPGLDGWEELDRSAALDGPYIVIVYNDSWHTFAEVEVQLQKATGCSLERAEAIAVEIHTRGRAIAYSGTLEDCERVANIIREIRLQVETDRAV